jgi:hypothetical protein
MKLPVYCVYCGAYLAGSWTQHLAGCKILALIRESGAAPANVPEDIRIHLESLAIEPEKL